MALTFRSVNILLLALLLSIKFLSSVEEQTQFIYNGFNGARTNLSGIAEIHPNGLLELTNTSYQQIGRAFFPFPFKFNTSLSNLSFSTNFVFAMVPELSGHGGHGIAFFISPSTDFIGAMETQYLGLLNLTDNGLASNHLFAVELDSAKSPDLEDINANHIGIDVNSLISIDAAPVSYFLEKEGRNQSLELISGNPMQVWIEYDETQKLINVTVAPINSLRPKEPLLSKKFDLSQILLESMYVGLSASTGSVASHHYILGWSFNKSGQAQGLDISKLPSLPKLKSRRNSRTMTLTIVLIVLVTTISCAGISAAYVIRRKTYEEVREDWEEQYGPQRISYKDLYKATKGFKAEEVIGAGGFGRVYRGVLPCSKKLVAIKKISHDSAQGTKEFIAEIASMGRLRHRNLVNLLGYCRRKGELLLVYDYMPNGSLDKFLFSNGKEKPILDWNQRYRILKGVASGLFYLHEEWEQVVLHRDVKSSNVLLDEDFNARLGDFGLSKLYDHGSNPETTCVVGTVGYLAPELTKIGKPTTSSDVFAFGTFMLEIASGRKPVEPQWQQKGMILADWVLECWKNEDVLSSCDSNLGGNYREDEMKLVLELGLLCTHPVPAARPGMRQVMQYLDGTAALPEEIQLEGDGNGNYGIGLVTDPNYNYSSANYSWPSINSALIYAR